jgi:hypothetical protein
MKSQDDDEYNKGEEKKIEKYKEGQSLFSF